LVYLCDCYIIKSEWLFDYLSLQCHDLTLLTSNRELKLGYLTNFSKNNRI